MNPIRATLAADQHNTAEFRAAFLHHGMMPLLEMLVDLSDDFRRSSADWVKEERPASFVDPESGGPRDDALLRIYMHGAADMELLYACGHLLRGHENAMYGHVRTMLESAGVALLSKSEPDLGEIYFSGDTDAFRRRTYSGAILPNDQPLTTRANVVFGFASKKIHANFLAMYRRTKTEGSTSEEWAHLRSEVRFHDIDPNDPGELLRPAFMLLTAGVDMLTLFAEGFEFPRTRGWWRGLEYLESRRRRYAADQHEHLILDVELDDEPGNGQETGD